MTLTNDSYYTHTHGGLENTVRDYRLYRRTRRKGFLDGWRVGDWRDRGGSTGVRDCGGVGR